MGAEKGGEGEQLLTSRLIRILTIPLGQRFERKRSDRDISEAQSREGLEHRPGAGQGETGQEGHRGQGQAEGHCSGTGIRPPLTDTLGRREEWDLLLLPGDAGAFLHLPWCQRRWR